jgi:PKHD-type hydroxylase
MTQWWQYWPRHFSDADCDRLISLAETIQPTEGRIGHGGGNVKDDSIRRSTIRWINRYDGRFFSFLGSMEILLHHANKNAFGFDLTLFHEIQFTEYHATNEGHYSWHHDTIWEGPQLFQRKLSMVVQLSNPADYDGGRFEMSKETCREVPPEDAILPRGTVIIFPSFLHHRVTPVTRGIRKSLVTWMEGPCFR